MVLAVVLSRIEGKFMSGGRIGHEEARGVYAIWAWKIFPTKNSGIDKLRKTGRGELCETAAVAVICLCRQRAVKPSN